MTTKTQKPKKEVSSKEVEFNVAYARRIEVGDGVLELVRVKDFKELDKQNPNKNQMIKGEHLSSEIRRNKAVHSAANGDSTETSKTRNIVEGQQVIVPIESGEHGETRFSLRSAFEMSVLPLDFVPAQNGNVQSRTLESTLNEFIFKEDEDVALDVTKRVVYNIFSGSWLSRNRSLATALSVRVQTRLFWDNGRVDEDSFEIKNSKLWDIDPNSGLSALKEDEKNNVEELATLLKTTLKAEQNNDSKPIPMVLRVFVEALIPDLAPGSKVYPSQMMTDSKSYFQVLTSSNNETSNSIRFGFTGEKIWNRLRCIDCWHFSYPSFEKKSIPVETLGSNLEYNVNFRPEGQGSMFDIFSYVLADAHDKPNLAHQNGRLYGYRCFALAWFLRGGALTQKKQK